MTASVLAEFKEHLTDEEDVEEMTCTIEEEGISGILSTISEYARRENRISVTICRTKAGFRLSMHSDPTDEPEVDSEDSVSMKATVPLSRSRVAMQPAH